MLKTKYVSIQPWLTRKITLNWVENWVCHGFKGNNLLIVIIKNEVNNPSTPHLVRGGFDSVGRRTSNKKDISGLEDIRLYWPT